MNQHEIREQFLKKSRGVKMCAVAKETGLSRGTLSRFKDGKSADLETLIRLSRWCGVRTFADGALVADGADTLGGVRRAIEGDRRLGESQKQKLWSLFEAMYLVLRF